MSIQLSLFNSKLNSALSATERVSNFIRDIFTPGPRTVSPKKKKIKSSHAKPKVSGTRSIAGDTGLFEIWRRLVIQYFPDRPDLLSYRISWSHRKQKRCLASCNAEKRQVNVSGALNTPYLNWVLEPLIYHELCHAVIGPVHRVRGQRRSLHGREFKILERRHPDIKKLDQWIRDGGWQRAVRAARARERENLK